MGLYIRMTTGDCLMLFIVDSALPMGTPTPFFFSTPVATHHKGPRLLVLAGRSQGSCVQYLLNIVPGHRPVQELSDTAPRLDCYSHLHGKHIQGSVADIISQCDQALQRQHSLNLRCPITLLLHHRLEEYIGIRENTRGRLLGQILFGIPANWIMDSRRRTL